MRCPRSLGVLPRLDDLLLVVLAAGLAIVLIRPGHGAQGARDVVRARTVVFQSLRLTVPNVPEGARPPLGATMSVRANGHAKLAFLDPDRWFLNLGIDQDGEPSLFTLIGQPWRGLSFRVEDSGSPSLDFRNEGDSVDLVLGMFHAAPTINWKRPGFSPVWIYIDGGRGTFTIELASALKQFGLSLTCMSGLTSIGLRPKGPGVSSLLGLKENGPPGLIHYRDGVPAVAISLDAMDSSFINEFDRTTGQGKTIHGP